MRSFCKRARKGQWLCVAALLPVVCLSFRPPVAAPPTQKTTARHSTVSSSSGGEPYPLPKLWTEDDVEPIVLKAAAFAEAVADRQTDELRRRRRARKQAAVNLALDRARKVWTGAVLPAVLGLTSWFLAFHLVPPLVSGGVGSTAANALLLSCYISHV